MAYDEIPIPGDGTGVSAGARRAFAITFLDKELFEQTGASPRRHRIGAKSMSFRWVQPSGPGF